MILLFAWAIVVVATRAAFAALSSTIFDTLYVDWQYYGAAFSAIHELDYRTTHTQFSMELLQFGRLSHKQRTYHRRTDRTQLIIAHFFPDRISLTN